MNLYCRIPFGRQHSKALEVIELAQALGRTPGSVAMKLNNLTSLDPEEKARGVTGLAGASRLDQDVWNDFHADWEGMAAKSEHLWQSTFAERESAQSQASGTQLPQDVPVGTTEGTRTVRVRLAQSFFRRAILSAYEGRCCISEIPIPELLVASHILPWADFPYQRVNPSNGLCLSRLHDTAFDKGFVTFDEGYRLVVSRRIKDCLPNQAIRVNFSVYEGKPLRLPEKFFPGQAFLAHHRENIFVES